ncbi:hypothetical protein AB0K46_24835 [Streptomyces cinnamoneus]
MEVEDAFCPWNEGRWRLVADAELRLAGPGAHQHPERDRLAVRAEPYPVAITLGPAGAVQILVGEIEIEFGVLLGHLLVEEIGFPQGEPWQVAPLRRGPSRARRTTPPPLELPA